MSDLSAEGILVVVIIICVTAFGCVLTISIAFGEQYTFNTSKTLNDEWRVLQLCIETDIKIDFCDTRYGGIDTDYGEKIDATK